MLYFTWNQNNKTRTTKTYYKQPKIILKHIKHNHEHQTNKYNEYKNYVKKLMWIILNKWRVHGKNTHLALDCEFRVCLTNLSVPTTQWLDWYDNNNQKNTIV